MKKSLKLLENLIPFKPNYKKNFSFFNNKTFFQSLLFRNYNSYDDNERIKKIMTRFDQDIMRREDYLSFLKFSQVITYNEEDKNLFMKYMSLAIEKNVLNYFTIAEIMPVLLKSSSFLQINDDNFWKIINTLFTHTYHKLGFNLIFQYLSCLETYYPDNINVEKIKSSYFKNLTRDKVLAFNNQTLINYLNLFIRHINEKVLLEDIQKLIIIQTIEKPEDLKENFLPIIEKHPGKFEMLSKHISGYNNKI